MPSKQDTGVCRQCGQRKNINKHGRVTRHNRLGEWCYGSQRPPIEGSEQYHDSGMHALTESIRELQLSMKAGKQKTDEDRFRALWTLRNLMDQLEAL